MQEIVAKKILNRLQMSYMFSGGLKAHANWLSDVTCGNNVQCTKLLLAVLKYGYNSWNWDHMEQNFLECDPSVYLIGLQLLFNVIYSKIVVIEKINYKYFIFSQYINFLSLSFFHLIQNLNQILICNKIPNWN